MKTSLVDYPTARFYTFEDSICADVNGRRVRLAILEPDCDQEQWNLVKCLVERATAMPNLLTALENITSHVEKMIMRGGDFSEVDWFSLILWTREAIARAKGETP